MYTFDKKKMNTKSR